MGGEGQRRGRKCVAFSPVVVPASGARSAESKEEMHIPARASRSIRSRGSPGFAGAAGGRRTRGPRTPWTRPIACCVERERERVVRGGTTGERRRARFGGAAAGVFGGRARACCVPPTWASVQRRKKARASGPLIRARAIKRAHEAPSKRDSWREKNRPSVEKGRAWHAPALSQAPTLTCWPRAAAPWGNGRSSRRRGGAPTRSSRARGARARAWSRGEKVDLGFGFFSARARAVAASWRGFLR